MLITLIRADDEYLR